MHYVVIHGCVHTGGGEIRYCRQLRDSLLISKVMFGMIYTKSTSWLLSVSWCRRHNWLGCFVAGARYIAPESRRDYESLARHWSMDGKEQWTDQPRLWKYAKHEKRHQADGVQINRQLKVDWLNVRKSRTFGSSRTMMRKMWWLRYSIVMMLWRRWKWNQVSIVVLAA